MKKIHVIKTKYLPIRLPLLSTAVAYLMLDKLNASALVYGIVGTIYALIWVLSIVGLAYQEQKDIDFK